MRAGLNLNKHELEKGKIMGDPVDIAKVVRYTADLITKLDQLNKKSDAEYKKTKADLEKAITNGTLPMLKLLRPKLQEEVDTMDDGMSKVEEAKVQIGALEDDQSYASTHFEQIKKLLEKVTDIQNDLTARIKQARDLDARALKAWDAAEGSQDEAEHELAVLKDTINDLKKVVDKNQPDIPKQTAAAKQAAAARNQKALTAARTRLIEYHGPSTKIPLARDKVNKFMKKYRYHDLNTEAQYLLDDLMQMDDAMKDLDEIIKELMDLHQVAQIDVGKACKILAITTKDQSRLAKVLNGQPTAYVKGLDDLAEDLELESTGKEMLAKLEKAQVV
jgi:chromosome segregation ATPase